MPPPGDTWREERGTHGRRTWHHVSGIVRVVEVSARHRQRYQVLVKMPADHPSRRADWREASGHSARVRAIEAGAREADRLGQLGQS